MGISFSTQLFDRVCPYLYIYLKGFMSKKKIILTTSQLAQIGEIVHNAMKHEWSIYDNKYTVQSFIASTVDRIQEVVEQ